MSSEERSNGQEQRKQDGEDKGPSTAEKMMMAVSTLFTLALFGYVIWEIVFVPAGPIIVHVVDTAAAPDGTVVTTELVNQQDIGVTAATVDIACGNVTRTLELSHIPADGRETRKVRCPSNTTEPTATLATWQEP